MTTSCWGDVVFTEKKFREYSCDFVDGGFEEFRNLGIRGGFRGDKSACRDVTPVASFKLGNRVFSTEKTFRVVSCGFVDGGFQEFWV